MEVQTRSEENGIRQFTSLSLAMLAAKRDPSIWKISYVSSDGSRVRLIKDESGEWIEEDIYHGLS